MRSHSGIREITIQAHAKLNLSLRITGKLPNGYHTLESVMVPLALFDDVTIRLTDTASKDTRIDCLTSWAKDTAYTTQPPLPQTQDNIATKAARLWLQDETLRTLATAQDFGAIQIEIQKRIPMGGGMGGGSTNAAAVLNGLTSLLIPPNKHVQAHDRLLTIGTRLGADVPFLLKSTPALCTGIGEIQEPCGWGKEWAQMAVLLIHPGVSIPTPWAYSEWDKQLSTSRTMPLNYGNLTEILTHGVNDFESIVFPLHPKMREAVQTMKAAGALTSRMTGSGSTLFAVGADLRSIEKIEQNLQQTFTNKFQNDGWYSKKTTGYYSVT